MTRDEATDLATRISQTWPRGVSAAVWEDELVELDAGRAGTTLVKLRRVAKHAPSIAEFWEMYQSVNTSDRSTRPPDCSSCDNQGTVASLEPRTVEVDGAPVEIEAWGPVRPCRCEWGQAKADGMAKAVAANGRELDRLFPARHQQPATPTASAPAAPAPMF
jgi:hypothetical protein